MGRGYQFTVYVNSELGKRLENLKGRAVPIQRVDLRGQPYTRLIQVPENDATIARLGLETLVEMAEEAAVNSTRKEEKDA